MQLTKKAYDIVAGEIRTSIESGHLQPGEKLMTIEELAKRFHVGKSTIREALSILKAEGFIESIQGGGTFVTNNPAQQFSQDTIKSLTSPSELKELLQVRKILEAGTIALAAVNRTEDNLQELKSIVEQMRNVIGNEEISQLHDVNFHRAIARATQNQMLADMMESLSSTMNRFIRDTRKLWLYGERESALHLFREHEKMYEAIRASDADLAVQVIHLHLVRVEKAFETMV